MQGNLRIYLACITATLLTSCGEKTPSNVVAPGADESAKTKMLEAGADLLQNKTPLRKLDAYLDGFHFYNGKMAAQMEAHHYCGHVNEDFIQCVIFDGNGENAKIMGVEYIISKVLFQTLGREEKRLWHSHVHEVRSGQLIAPGIPDIAEHELMEKIAGTYGKTWHTWHTDEHLTLPTGTPQLMMGFTQDGQADEQMVADRDARFGIASGEKRAQRSDIRYPVVDTDADAWQKGVVPQIGVVPQVTPGSGH
jgi:uncharacterized protein DUF1264